MPLIQTEDGTNISFSDQGSGFPILFLHGWMMSKRVWHFQLPLASSLRIITLDLRGHGESGAAEFSYADCLSDIEDLFDYLGIEKAVITGWSMGAQLALKSSAILKNRLAGLILVGGTPRFCSSADYSGGLPLNEARGMAIRIKRDYRGTSGQFFTSMFSEAETATSDLKDIAAKTAFTLPPLQVALSALQELTNADLRHLLPGINNPVHLIHGAEDNICPVEAAEFMAGHLPSATLKLFPFSGHAPFMAAADKFNAEVIDFVRTLNG